MALQVSGSIRIPFVVNGVDGTNGTDGKDGITWRVTEYLLFAPEDSTHYIYVGAWRGTTSLITSSTQVSVPSSPANGVVGVNGRGWNSEGQYVIEVSRGTNLTYEFDWDAEVGVTIDGVAYTFTIPVRSVFNGDPGDKGDKGDSGTSAVSLDAYPDTLVFAEGATQVTLYMHLYEGTTLIAYGNYSLTLGTAPTGTTVMSASGTYNNKSGRRITFSRTSSTTEVDGAYTYTVTYVDVSISRTVHVMSPASDGEDAVVYTLVPSSTNLIYYASRGAYSPETITLTYYKTTGNSREAQNAYWNGTIKFSDGTTGSVSGSQVSSLTFNPSSYSQIVESVTVKAHVGSAEDSTTAEFTLYTSHSCQPRTLDWDNCASGFEFQSGQLGDYYIDTVVHNNKMYQCIGTHMKGVGNDEPGVGSMSGAYWTGVNWFDNVATNLLLANTASIANLYAEDVYMESSGDKPTAVWISAQHDGMKVMKKDDLSKSGRENQNLGDWSNPTAWFHGGNIPTTSVYSSAVSSSLTYPSAGTMYSNSTTHDYSNLSSITRVSYTSVGSLTANVLIIVTASAGSTYIRLTEGNLDSSATSDTSGQYLQYSRVYVYLRAASSLANLTSSGKYVTLWSAYLKGTGTSGGTTTEYVGDIDSSITLDGTTMYVGLFYDNLELRRGGSLAMSGTIALSINSTTEAYLSQFGADGLFIGRTSGSYARICLGSTPQHTLLAGGYGIDIVEGVTRQYVNGKYFPLGGAIFAGYFYLSTGRLYAQYWTYDNSSLYSLTYSSAGYYIFVLPTTWARSMDLTDGTKLCITATVHRDNNSTGAYAKVNNIGSRTISITTHGADGVMADFPFYVRIDYFEAPLSANVVQGSTVTLSTDGKVLSESNAESINAIMEAQAEEITDKEGEV